MTMTSAVDLARKDCDERKLVGLRVSMAHNPCVRHRSSAACVPLSALSLGPQKCLRVLAGFCFCAACTLWEGCAAWMCLSSWMGTLAVGASAVSVEAGAAWSVSLWYPSTESLVCICTPAVVR